jgi:DNA-binding transcriptional ArsR family regulator
MAILPYCHIEGVNHLERMMQARLDARARIIKAIAHPSRLFIVEELNKAERCVCELTEMIGSDASTVSKHLGILKNAGLVEDEKRGTNIYYHLRVPCILDFIGCVETVLETNANKQIEIARCCKR